MRTFAQKQKPSQQIKFTGSTTRGQAFPTQNYAVRLILHLQRTIGNQAVQRLLQADAKDLKWESDAISIASSPKANISGSPLSLSRLPLLRLQRQHVSSPYRNILPTYSQEGPKCAAASLVMALIIWDREHWHAGKPNHRVVNACNLILSELHRKRRYGNKTHSVIIQRIRNDARKRGAKVSENDYHGLVSALYFLWSAGTHPGLSSLDVEGMQEMFGLAPRGSSTSRRIRSFDEIFSNSIITGLMRDQFAQIFWVTTRGVRHVFLLGRLKSGKWFLYDQGPSLPAVFCASTLAKLKKEVRFTITMKSYNLFLGTHSDLGRVRIPGWTGIKRLGSHSSVEKKAQNVVPPNAFLGEVDKGWWVTGDRIKRQIFAATRYSLSKAQRFSAAGLIVETPKGVFTVYTTTGVSKENLNETKLDIPGSSGGVLLPSKKRFLHAWLRLGTLHGQWGQWFQVY